MTVTRGFATNKDQTDWLHKHGLPHKAIYQTGRGAENLDECLASYRGRVGKLIIAHDLRVFAVTKKQIAATMARLETARIRVVDVAHPGDTTIADMIQRASVKLSNTGLTSKNAKKRGRKGGLGKGVGAQLLRESLAPTWLVDRIVNCPHLNWLQRADLLAPHFTQTTLRRHYGQFATARKP